MQMSFIHAIQNAYTLPLIDEGTKIEYSVANRLDCCDIGLAAFARKEKQMTEHTHV